MDFPPVYFNGKGTINVGDLVSMGPPFRAETEYALVIALNDPNLAKHVQGTITVLTEKGCLWTRYSVAGIRLVVRDLHR